MPETIDIILRTVAVMASHLLAGLLATTGRRRRAALPGMFFCLAVAAFFVTSVPGASNYLSGWFYPLTALCVTKAVWFWLFARTLFTDDATLEPRHLLMVAAAAAAGTWQQTVFLEHYRAGTAAPLEMFFGFGFDGILLLFVLLGPPDNAAEHLDTLTEIARLTTDDDFRYDAARAKNGVEMLAALDSFIARTTAPPPRPPKGHAIPIGHLLLPEPEVVNTVNVTDMVFSMLSLTEHLEHRLRR